MNDWEGKTRQKSSEAILERIAKALNSGSDREVGIQLKLRLFSGCLIEKEKSNDHLVDVFVQWMGSDTFYLNRQDNHIIDHSNQDRFKS